MSGSYWRQVQAEGLAVPTDRPLDDLTAELTRMLGDPDPALREGIAVPTLSEWIARGVYDDLLAGLGDGLALGLLTGLGQRRGEAVFRRSMSALVLGRCIERDNQRPLVPGGKVLEWGDRLATWLLREQDLRAVVPGHGWVRAVDHGAEALTALARSPHLSTPELTVVLDVIADRVLGTGDELFGHGETDALAATTLAVLRREVLPLAVVEPWVARVAATAGTLGAYDDRDPYLLSGNAEAFLRALYLQLSLAARPPGLRSDLLLVLVEALRATNARYLHPDYLDPVR